MLIKIKKIKKKFYNWILGFLFYPYFQNVFISVGGRVKDVSKYPVFGLKLVNIDCEVAKYYLAPKLYKKPKLCPVFNFNIPI